jgi:hypothetical protein
MAITAHQSKPRPTPPRERPKKRNHPITDLEPQYIGWNGLAAVIIERAMIEEQALGMLPKEAKRLRSSDEAIRLEARERKLWKAAGATAAEYVLDALVIEADNPLRSELKAIVEERLLRLFTQATSALLPAALLASPELRPRRAGGR